MGKYKTTETCGSCRGNGSYQEYGYDSNGYNNGKWVKCSSCGGSGYVEVEYKTEDKPYDQYQKELTSYKEERRKLQEHLDYCVEQSRKNNNDRSFQYVVNCREELRNLKEPSRTIIVDRKVKK